MYPKLSLMTFLFALVILFSAYTGGKQGVASAFWGGFGYSYSEPRCYSCNYAPQYGYYSDQDYYYSNQYYHPNYNDGYYYYPSYYYTPSRNYYYRGGGWDNGYRGYGGYGRHYR